jgi:tripartite-type tricarboxylate transporter receptor subunit TctC
MQQLIRSTLAVLAATGACAVEAQVYPSKTINFIIGFAAGGNVDLMARVAAEDMRTRLGQNIVVENRAGATGVIAWDAVRAAPADGHTITLFVAPTLNNFHLIAKPFDPEKDITPLGIMYNSSTPLIVNPASPFMENVRTLADLVAAAKSNPGKINYSSAGPGSLGHLFGERLKAVAGINYQHIAYKGIAPAASDLMAGTISFMFGGPNNGPALVKEGKLRAIAVTGAKPHIEYTMAPTIDKTPWPQLAATSWGGLASNGGTPRPIAERLAAEFRTTMAKPEVLEKIKLFDPNYGPAEEFAKLIASDWKIWGEVIRQAGIKAQ